MSYKMCALCEYRALNEDGKHACIKTLKIIDHVFNDNCEMFRMDDQYKDYKVIIG